MEEYYFNKMKEMAKQFKELKSEIYQKVSEEDKKEFFEDTLSRFFIVEKHLNGLIEQVTLYDYIEE